MPVEAPLSRLRRRLQLRAWPRAPPPRKLARPRSPGPTRPPAKNGPVGSWRKRDRTNRGPHSPSLPKIPSEPTQAPVCPQETPTLISGLGLASGPYVLAWGISGYLRVYGGGASRGVWKMAGRVGVGGRVAVPVGPRTGIGHRVGAWNVEAWDCRERHWWELAASSWCRMARTGAAREVDRSPLPGVPEGKKAYPKASRGGVRW